jgi:hypothetical protein
MEFDDLADINDDLRQRLSSWRRLPDVVERSTDFLEEASINEAQVRQRQQRIAKMCLNMVKAHDAFMAELKAEIANSDKRDPMHQQRVEDEAAFALGVFEQSSALCLEIGIQRELDDLPKEIVETVFVQPPTPQKSWFQRFLGS